MIVKKTVRPVQLHINEKSIAAKLEKVRGFAALNQLQTLYHVTKTVLNLNPHDRIFAPGSTNRGNVIGPLALDDMADPNATWSMMFKDKLVLLGRHGPRIPVGGKVGEEAREEDGDADEEAGDAGSAADAKREKTQVEPLLFHSPPMSLRVELMHALDSVCAFSLAGEGKTAMVAMERGHMCFLLAYTPEHAAWLKQRLQAIVFKKHQDPESKLHEPGLVTLMNRNLPAGQHPHTLHPPLAQNTISHVGTCIVRRLLHILVGEHPVCLNLWIQFKNNRFVLASPRAHVLKSLV